MIVMSSCSEVRGFIVISSHRTRVWRAIGARTLKLGWVRREGRERGREGRERGREGEEGKEGGRKDGGRNTHTLTPYQSKDIEISLGEEGGRGGREVGGRGRGEVGKEGGRKRGEEGGRNTHTLTPSQA